MTAIDPPFVRSLLTATDKADTPNVVLCKNTFRAAMYELLRLMESQNDIDTKKSFFIQSLTFEYACVYIADRLLDLEREIPVGTSPRAALLHAYQEVLAMKHEAMIPVAGRA